MVDDFSEAQSTDIRHMRLKQLRSETVGESERSGKKGPSGFGALI